MTTIISSHSSVEATTVDNGSREWDRSHYRAESLQDIEEIKKADHGRQGTAGEDQFLMLYSITDDPRQ